MEKIVAGTTGSNPVRVLYLTHLENDVWESIQSAVEEIDGTPRLSVPNTPERLIERWRGPGLSCTRREYVAALERFIEAGFIVSINTHTARADGYRLAVNPDDYLVRVIRRRLPLYLPSYIISKTLEDLKRFDDATTPLPTYEDLRTMLEYEQPEALPSGFRALGHTHLIWMYVGGIPHTDPKDVFAPNARGVYFKVNEGGQYIPSHPAFLPFRYYDVYTQPVFVAHMCLKPDANGSNKPFFIVPNDRKTISRSDDFFDDTGELSGHLFDPSDLEDIGDAELSLRMEMCEMASQLIADGTPLLKSVFAVREVERQRIEQERVALLERQRRAEELREQIAAMRLELSVLEADG